MDLKQLIRNIPDFPKPGIIYRDITTLLANPEAMQFCKQEFLNHLPDHAQINKVIGIEARGFFFAALLADTLQAGLVPVRKAGKLPFETHSASYALEYGEDQLELHRDAIQPGDQVLIHDDVLATGGTALAAAHLVQQCGGEIVQFNFIIELEKLQGRKMIQDFPLYSLVKF